MSDSDLPLPLTAPPWWVGAGAAAVGAALALPALARPRAVVSVIDWPLWPLALVVTGLAVCAGSLLQRRACAKRAEAARALGLSFRPRLRESDLRELLEHSLFALTAYRGPYGGYVCHGTFEGEPVVVFDYGFAGAFRTTEEGRSLLAGRQTVFHLPSAGGVPDFHLAPADSDWDELIVTRRWLFLTGDVAFEIDIGGATAVLRGADEAALRRLFRREQREALGLFPGWTIECRGGRLLFYRDRKAVPPDEIGHYLHQAVRAARALRAAVPAPAPEGPARPADHRIRPEGLDPP
jgi:hypothetical protein